MKKNKYRYQTVEVRDATSTPSRYPSDMAMIDIPEYIVVSKYNLPVVCRDLSDGLRYAMEASARTTDANDEFRLINTLSFKTIVTYKEGKSI